MRKTLFRTEVSAASSNNWFGQVVLLQPLSIRLVTLSIVLLVCGVVFFLCNAHYTKRILVGGILTPDKGLIKVLSPQSAIVLERRVNEGQIVQAGEVLYVLTGESMYQSRNSHNVALGLTSTALDQLRKKQDLIRSDDQRSIEIAVNEDRQERSKIDSLRSEIQQLDQEIAIQVQRTDSKVMQYEGNVQAQNQGFISSLGLKQKHDELLDQKARLSSMQRTRIGLMRDLAASESNLESLRIKQAIARSQFERQILDVEQDRITRESVNKIVVTAPQAGKVAAILAEPGQRIDLQPLLSLLPSDSMLEVQLFIPSNFIGQIKEGDKVNIHVSAFPHQFFGGLSGEISEISSTTLNTAEQLIGVQSVDSGNKIDAKYRVRVQLSKQDIMAFGKEKELRSGMQVEAQIAQSNRTLIDWIIEPLRKLKDKT